MRKFRIRLFILCTLACMANWLMAQDQAPVAKKGLLDLRNQDLSAREVKLDGEWNFYWNQLLNPGDNPGDTGTYTDFPSLWEEDTFHGKQRSSRGFATYHLRLLLPHQRTALGLMIPDTYCAYALFADGKLIAKNGRPAKDAQASTPFWATQVSPLPANLDTLDLQLQVSNFWHAKGGVYKSIVIGNYETLVTSHRREIAYAFVLAGCLFMGGLFFLGLYLLGRKDNAMLFFSLFCIFYSYRMVGADSHVLHYVFHDLNWFITLKLEYFSTVMSVACFALYTRHLFIEDCNERMTKMLVAICLLYLILIATTPTLFFTGLMPFFLGSMFIFLGYAFYVYIQAALHQRIGSVYGLLSSLVMIVIFLVTNLNYFRVVYPVKSVLLVAYILFFFLQSLALSQRFAHSFRLANLQAQQGLNAKAAFLSTMSHEIRTPLNAVIGMAHLLKINQPREDQQENLDVLYFSANNLLSIVNNILDYTKIEEGKIVFESIPMDLQSIAVKIIAGFKKNAEDKGIALKLSVDERLTQKIMGDPTRMSQVMNNLVHNAVKFTSSGWVCLSVEMDALHANSVVLTVKVQDTGIGIPQEKQRIIFDRFTQADSSTSRSYGGTGLGLAITKRILELQGVELKLHSEAGKGSLFYFTQTFLISREDPVGSLQDNDVLHNPDLLQGLSILLVEDNPLNVLVAQTILEKKGARIDVATNGQEAIEKFDTQKHKLILMDLHMPVLDGYKATEQLRQKGETIPIIALTASAQKEVAHEAYASGLDDIIMKPFNPDDLFRTILQYVKAG